MREGTEGVLGAPYIGRAARFLGTIFRSGARPLAVLLGVRFVQVSQLRTLT